MMRWIARSALAAAVALTAAASATTAASSPLVEIVVTRDSVKLPAGCSVREVGALLSRFTRAVTDGDQAELARLFVTVDPPGRAVEPAGSVFRWYSATEGRSRAARPWRHRAQYDRADLLAYFAERHVQNERMELIEAEVRPNSRLREVGIIFRVRREADDLPSWLSPYAGGKAGIDCTSSTPGGRPAPDHPARSSALRSSPARAAQTPKRWRRAFAPRRRASICRGRASLSACG